jgi:protocatechuate 4,5-dioxygenase, alpha chain
MGFMSTHLFIFGHGIPILQAIHSLFGEIPMTQPTRQIEGTTPFDGDMARKGFALNKMCFSFNSADNRAAFKRDEEAYMSQFGLTEPQKAAIRSRQVLELIAAGGNAYYLAKFAGIFGLDMQDIGAQQTGMTKDEFKAKLQAYAFH